MGQPLINISRKHAFTFAGFFVLYEFLTYIANDMIMPGMVAVVASFHGPESAIASSLTAYILGGASLQLILGPLSDRYGRRPVMLSGTVLFFLCTLLIAHAQNMDQFIAFRFLQGMGLCFIGVVGYATIQEIFAEMDAVRLIAILSNISILAPAIGPVLGAIIIYYSHWQMIFYMIAFFALFALGGLWRYMPESVGQTMINGEKIEKSPISPYAIWTNYKKLILNPTFMFGTFGISVLIVPCLAWIALAPVILIKEAHLTPIAYSLWQIPLFLIVIVGNWVLHWMTHRYPLQKIILLGSSFSFLGLFMACLLPFIWGESFIWLIPGLFIYFFSFGLISAPLNRFILYATKIAKGTASALLSIIIMLVQGIGIEVGNWIYKNHVNSHFGLYCACIGLIYGFFLWLMFKKNNPGITH